MSVDTSNPSPPKYGRAATAGETPCLRCGWVHLRCTSHTRNKVTGEYDVPCGRPPRPGLAVCATHGGKAPQSIRAGERRVALGRISAELERQGRLGGGELDVDPAEAMLAMVREAAFNVAVLRDLVAQLDASVSTGGGTDGEAPSPLAAIAGLTGSQSKFLEAAPHVLVTMYDSERDKLVRWSKMCREAGVDEAVAAAQVREADAVVGVLRGVTDALLALVVGVLESSAPGVVTTVRDVWSAELPGIVAGELEAAT